MLIWLFSIFLLCSLRSGMSRDHLLIFISRQNSNLDRPLELDNMGVCMMEFFKDKVHFELGEVTRVMVDVFYFLVINFVKFSLQAVSCNVQFVRKIGRFVEILEGF